MRQPEKGSNMPTMPTQTLMFLFATGASGLDQITTLGDVFLFFADKTLRGRFIPGNAKKQPLEESVVFAGDERILP